MTASTSGRHRVVIVGGGFGGLPAARSLGRKRYARAGVEVTVADRRNHRLFQPLLHQVATGLILPGQISPALRHVVRKHKNVRVELTEVTRVRPGPRFRPGHRHLRRVVREPEPTRLRSVPKRLGRPARHRKDLM